MLDTTLNNGSSKLSQVSEAGKGSLSFLILMALPHCRDAVQTLLLQHAMLLW